MYILLHINLKFKITKKPKIYLLKIKNKIIIDKIFDKFKYKIN